MLVLLDDVLEEALKSMDKVGVEGEFYGLSTRSVRVEVSRGRVSRVLAREHVSYGVRVDAGGGRVASIDSGEARVDKVHGLVEKAYEIARYREPIPGWRGFSRGYGVRVNPRIFDRRLNSLSQEDAVSILNNIVDTCTNAAAEAGAEKSIITGGSLNAYSTRILVGNSSGESIDCMVTVFTVNLQVKSIVGGLESSYIMSFSSRMLDEDQVLEKASESGELSVRFKSPAVVGGGSYKIVLMPRVIGYLASTALAPAFSALNIQENRSPLKGRVGERILSGDIDVIDDPWIDWRIGSRGFDDEGIATRRKLVVEKGVFKQPIYDYYTACRDGVESTGNGFRSSPSSQPTPSFTNLILRVGGESFSLDEIESLGGSYIILYDVIGYWMSNPVNGDVQATATHALMVSGGNVKPVKGFVVRGNIYEVLGVGIEGSSKEYVIEGSIEAPAVMVSCLKISG